MLFDGGIMGRNQCFHIASTEWQEQSSLSRIFSNDIRSSFRTGNPLETENHRTCRRTVLQSDLRLKAGIFLIQRNHDLRIGIRHNRAFIGFAFHDYILSLGILIKTQTAATCFLESTFQVVQPNRRAICRH